MGFAPTDNGLGIMCRVSQKQVVNVAQHGGMAAVLLAHPPAELHIPRRSRALGADTVEAALRAEISELLNLDRAIAVLEWDEEVLLPELGREDRGGQLATLEAIRHKLLVADRLSDLIEEVSLSGSGEWPREIALLKRLRHDAMAMPEELVRELAAARAAATGAWEAAREKDDFALFAPFLGKLVGLVRSRAEALSTGGTRYDALLELYEPGMTFKRLMPVLQDLRSKLVPIVDRLAQPEDRGPDPLAAVSESARWNIALDVLKKMGFDFKRGRLDTSTHPFTTQLGGGDVRLTIRKKEQLAIAMLTILHEGGHALYDLGFPSADRMSLLGDAPSMGMHEGQSRLWENHVGRSAAFWKFVLPLIGEAAGTSDLGIRAEDLYRSVNRVTRGTVRTSADEISYHLHIILRVELESALLDGGLQVRDLKSAWNERSRAILGAEPKSDLAGVLQDSHWAGGMFGYFPTYTIGSLYAAQLAEAYAKTHSFQDEIGRGEFGPLLGWLRKHVHAAGHRFDAEELMIQVTGNGLDPAAYFRHLESKFR
jgi:carboxypeptidase Taq